MRRLEDLNIDIFADGADLINIATLAKDPLIKGFTTNPTLMRKAGVRNYETWARHVLELVPDKPVSFEVLADDFKEMERQARKIASWGSNVWVKIPVMNTREESSLRLVQSLSSDMHINVTGITVAKQLEIAYPLPYGRPVYLSIFAGRVADTGEDPSVVFKKGISNLRPWPYIRIIWASPREMLNIFQAQAIGCHAITVPTEILAKRHLIGKDLLQYSLETVQQFHRDAVEAGYTL